jgi:PPM family protein phosphatase
VELTYASRTDVGMIRAGNEDSVHAGATSHRGLFMVADGMGGHAAGEVASAMAVQILTREITALGPVTLDVAEQALRAAIRSANRAIFERTIAESEKQGMGTTVSVLLLLGGHYLIGQVGDSRIYRWRENRLEQLTKDHSYVQEQVDAGYLTPAQARAHPYSNVITRCVGATPDLDPDTFVGELRAGDLFLIASDGLTGMIEDDRLQQIIASRVSPGRLVDTLIHEANGRGGLDNITAVVVQVIAADRQDGGGTTGEHPTISASHGP